MKTLFAVLQLLPLILTVVRAVEEALPLPGQGKKKLDLILDILKTAYDGGTEQKQFSWQKLVALVVPMIARIVDLHNELGLFSTKAAEPGKAGATT